MSLINYRAHIVTWKCIHTYTRYVSNFKTQIKVCSIYTMWSQAHFDYYRICFLNLKIKRAKILTCLKNHIMATIKTSDDGDDNRGLLMILKSFWQENVRGHLWVLHWRFSRVSPRQGCPPFRANISIVRSRLWTPPSQLLLQSLHRLNSVHLQSIGDPKSYVAVVKIFIDSINLIKTHTLL